MTSPRPPVFENGAHAAPTMTMFRRSSATTRSDDVRDLFDVPARVGATRGAASRARELIRNFILINVYIKLTESLNLPAHLLLCFEKNNE